MEPGDKWKGARRPSKWIYVDPVAWLSPPARCYSFLTREKISNGGPKEACMGRLWFYSSIWWSVFQLFQNTIFSYKSKACFGNEVQIMKTYLRQKVEVYHPATSLPPTIEFCSSERITHNHLVMTFWTFLHIQKDYFMSSARKLAPTPALLHSIICCGHWDMSHLILFLFFVIN